MINAIKQKAMNVCLYMYVGNESEKIYTVWNGMAWYGGMVWYGMVLIWYGLIW